MIDFVIFVILTCQYPTDVVVVDMKNSVYYEGGRVQDIPEVVPEDSTILFVPVENNVGVCT